MLPRVTVITSTHCRPDFLRRCIISVKNQKFQQYEHLIIADHCPYAKKVYDDFKDDKRIKYYETKEHIVNYGAVAKNLGIKLSSTDLICYCDDDNVLLPHHLDLLYKNMEGRDAVFAIFGLREESKMSYDDIFKIDLYDCSKIAFFSTDDLIVCMHTKKAIQKIGGWIPISALHGIDSENWHVQKHFYESDLIMGDIGNFTCIYTGQKRKDLIYKQEYFKRIENMQENQIYAYPDVSYSELSFRYNNKDFIEANRRLLLFLKRCKVNYFKKNSYLFYSI